VTGHSDRLVDRFRPERTRRFAEAAAAEAMRFAEEPHT
jgi:hypothetical protein